MVRFIHTTPDRPSPWRRQARQACAACRRSKKRCKHVGGAGPVSALTREGRGVGETIEASISGLEEDGNPEIDVGVQSLPIGPASNERLSPHKESEQSQGSDAHFVGDLNPESTFLADSPEASRGYAEADGIGVWVSRRVAATGAARGSGRSSRPPSAILAFSPGTTPEACLAIIPVEANYKRLEEIYLRDTHKILPVIDLDVLYGTTSTVAQVLSRQAVCLAAAGHPDAKPFLTLGSSAEMLSYTAFSHRLISAMRTILNAGLESDRLQLIPPLVILALNTYSSPDRHLSADLASLAVSYTQTVGLHHRSPPASQDLDRLESLFCCVWAMDRLNAAFHGRPVLMHERDVGRDMGGCFAWRGACFRLFLECVMLLDGVIQLYRPTVVNSEQSGWELPRFEELVERAGALALESRLLATIELLYHSIVILSCRAPSATRAAAMSVTPRESLSTLSITSILAESRDSLPHFILVPYAASLALRTTYRELRTNSVPTVRARLFRQLRENCGILRMFGDMYRPASAMVELVDRLTREIGRTSGGVAQSADEPMDRGANTPDTGRDGAHRERESPVTGGVSVHPEARASPVADSMVVDSLERLNVFDSLNFDFDFEALDAAFGDGTYPSCPPAFI